MNDQLHVVAVLRAQSERLEDVTALLRTLAAPTREEPGCIEYRFVQDTNNPSVILSMEQWRDQAAFEEHLASSHFQSAIEALQPLLQAEPAIHTCTTIV
jgi:quinol monooxygenase YgiN